MDTFISYEGLPINSGGAHQLGGKKPGDILADVLEFLRHFTNNDAPEALHFIFYSSRKGTYRSWPIVWKLTKQFGIPAYDSTKFAGKRERVFTWKLGLDKLDPGMQWLEFASGMPDNDFGPIVLSALWTFRFTDPESGAMLKGQEHIPMLGMAHENSRIYLRLAKKSTMSVWFAWPFAEMDRDSKAYISSMAQYLPFKFSDKHWRIWKRSKKGNWISHVLDINQPI